MRWVLAGAFKAMGEDGQEYTLFEYKTEMGEDWPKGLIRLTKFTTADGKDVRVNPDENGAFILHDNLVVRKV